MASSKEIAKRHGWDREHFERYITHETPYSVTFGKIDIPDSLIPELEKRYEQSMRDKIEEQHAMEREREIEKQEIAKILITSGYSFEGYHIRKYSGYISGDDAVQIPRSGVFGGNNGKNLTDALVKIRRQALKELKEAAYDLGCNAVIGVDFDYITLEPETANLGGGTLYEPYIICVTANGTAVVIERKHREQ